MRRGRLEARTRQEDQTKTFKETARVFGPTLVRVLSILSGNRYDATTGLARNVGKDGCIVGSATSLVMSHQARRSGAPSHWADESNETRPNAKSPASWGSWHLVEPPQLSHAKAVGRSREAWSTIESN